MVHPDQDDKNCKHICMTRRVFYKLSLDVYGIDANIHTQLIFKKHILPVQFMALDNGIKPDIGTLNKDRSDIFSECYAQIFKAKILGYVNKVWFEMVKTSFKGAYLGGTNPTALQNEVSTFCKMYYDRENLVIVNQSLNKFYTRLLFKIDALPQHVAFSLYIAETFFNSFIPDVRELLIS